MCNVLVSLTKRPNPVSGSFRHLNKYITHRTTASSQLTSSEGFPIFFTAPMTARFLFRFGMLRTFKHKTRGHRPRPQSSGALCAFWLTKFAISSHLHMTARFSVKVRDLSNPETKDGVVIDLPYRKNYFYRFKRYKPLESNRSGKTVGAFYDEMDGTQFDPGQPGTSSGGAVCHRTPIAGRAR